MFLHLPPFKCRVSTLIQVRTGELVPRETISALNDPSPSPIHGDVCLLWTESVDLLPLATPAPLWTHLSTWVKSLCHLPPRCWKKCRLLPTKSIITSPRRLPSEGCVSRVVSFILLSLQHVDSVCNWSQGNRYIGKKGKQKQTNANPSSTSSLTDFRYNLAW